MIRLCRSVVNLFRVFRVTRHDRLHCAIELEIQPVTASGISSPSSKEKCSIRPRCLYEGKVCNGACVNRVFDRSFLVRVVVVTAASRRPSVNSLMKNYDEGGIGGSLSPIRPAQRCLVVGDMRRQRMAARRSHGRPQCSRASLGVCFVARSSLSLLPVSLGSVRFLHVASDAAVINSVANPSPRESGNPACVRPVYDEFGCSRTSSDETSRVCIVSLVEGRACVSTFVCVLSCRRRRRRRCRFSC